MGEGTMKERYRLDVLDDVISTTSAVFLGQTIGCARCHDHKLDPITQAEYYRVLAIFDPTQRVDVALDDEGALQSSRRSTEGKTREGEEGAEVVDHGLDGCCRIAANDAPAVARRCVESRAGGRTGRSRRDGDRAAEHFRFDRWDQNDRASQGVGRVDRFAAQSAHLAGRGQSHLAASSRRRDRRHAEQFRPIRAAPTHPELLDYLAQEMLASRRELEIAPPPDRHLGDLSTGEQPERRRSHEGNEG